MQAPHTVSALHLVTGQPVDFRPSDPTQPTIDASTPGTHRYGAPMGRAEWRRPATVGRLRLFRVRLDQGGYDRGGHYWGTGQALYCATDCEDFRTFTRAPSREAARRTVAALPEFRTTPATFYR